ncbi:MAG: hypothetical protein KAH18_01080 [Psychromonas sp.]|nr:hypothetical protein [Psychromonas sp.]
MESSSMTENEVKSPIQLMATWFVMLVSITTVLLTTASKIQKPEWAAGYLVISDTVVIFIVIGCVLLMLTKFRPNLQDGEQYATWIKDQGEYSEGKILQTQNPTVEDLPNKVKTSDIKNVSVSVLDVLGGADVVESLKNKGFNADVHEFNLKGSDKSKPLKLIKGRQEGIWVGVRVEADIAIKAIQVAIKVWPDLKYVMIPSDANNPPDHVNDQIFIGGTSDTPIKRGIQAWSINEFNSLKEDMSIDEFHREIRDKYA